jgi:hypothetical protein
MVDYLSITEKILSLTRSMLAAAEASEWNKVQEQDARREMLLKNLNVSGEVSGEHTNNIAANLEEAISLNARIIDLGLREKTETAKTISELQRGRKANRAYNGIG